MDERAPSPAHSPLPFTSYTLKSENYNDSPESEEESNPLEQEDSLEPEKQFLVTFQSLEVLWDPKNRHYTNRLKRNKALEVLLPILRKIKPGATIQEVKNKINGFRSNYRKELRKVNASQRIESDINEVYKPTVWYYPYLDFLRKLEQRPPAQQAEFGLEEPNTQQRNEIPQIRTSISSIASPVSNPQSRLRKRTAQGQLVDTPNHSPPKPCTDNWQSKKITSHIVLDWADTLDKLDPLQRLYAKKAIADVLFEAELGNLRKHSVKINEPDSNSSTHHPSFYVVSSTLKSGPSPTLPCQPKSFTGPGC